MAAAMGSSFLVTCDAHLSSSPPGTGLRSSRQGFVNVNSSSLSLGSKHLRKSRLVAGKRQITIQASQSGQGGRSGSTSIFVGGFILGGIIVGTLGCVFAPQISRAIAGTDRKDLMRKLPKFIYDEEKALEKTRKVLAEKIAQLNSAIDDVSSQLRADEGPNGAAVTSDEVEAAA